jgi:hypothetical protein
MPSVSFVSLPTTVDMAEISTVKRSASNAGGSPMHPELHSRFASERMKDDHSGLAPEREGTATLTTETITIRPLREDDVGVVERLAELDERPVPPGPLLLAEIEGTVEAVVALDGDEAIANPFAPSADAVSLLRLRADQLRED